MLNSSERCGPNQVIYGMTECCICAPNTANTGTGCVACGEHEMPGASSCVCEIGFARSTTGACEPALPGQGVPCSTSMPCTDATFNHCTAEGYCTNTGCTATDCTGGYACDLSAATPYCKRPPVGLGMSCTSNTDCAGTQATFCDTMFAHACLEQGCSVSPNNCFVGSVCCDLTSVGLPGTTLCIPPGACAQ